MDRPAVTPSAHAAADANAPDWIRTRLVCPRDHQALIDCGSALVCTSGHRYPIYDGVPILLLDDIEHTHNTALYSLRGEEGEYGPSGPYGIDSYVQKAIGATGGYLYAGLIGRLTEYPIPELRMPPGHGKVLLDIGCSWGRWSVAAARLGYRVVGIDPSLVGVRAARRVARQLGVDASFIVADARYLPLSDGCIDAVFSYSVLQHFAKADVRRTLAEIQRVLAPDGRSLIQLPNALGIRSLYHQVKRRLREPRLFEVRYWTVAELRRTFERYLGPSSVAVDGFFSLNAQAADLHLLALRGRVVVRASEALRRMTRALPFLRHIADSLYVSSQRDPRAPEPRRAPPSALARRA